MEYFPVHPAQHGLVFTGSC